MSARLPKPPAATVLLVAVGAFVQPADAAVLPENAPEVSAMRASVDHALHWIATGIEVAGVAIIVIGALLASLLFA
jgi:hypothetical protein